MEAAGALLKVRVNPLTLIELVIVKVHVWQLVDVLLKFELVRCVELSEKESVQFGCVPVWAKQMGPSRSSRRYFRVRMGCILHDLASKR